MTLPDELTRRGQYQAFGGDEMLLDIANSVPHAANARYHAELVKQKSLTRQLIQGPWRYNVRVTLACSQRSNFLSQRSGS